MKIVEEGTHIGLKSFVRICGPDVLQLPLTRLMDKPKPTFPIRQTVKRFGHATIDRLCPLAAAEDQDRVRLGVGLRWNGFELRPDRVPCNNGTLTEKRLRARIRDGCKIDPLTQHSIRETRNGILFHYNAWIIAESCSAQHRKRRVATNADHHVGIEFTQNFSRFENGTPHAHQVTNLTANAETLDPANRQCAQLKPFFGDDSCFNALFCSNKQNFRPSVATLNLSRHGNTRKQVP